MKTIYRSVLCVLVLLAVPRLAAAHPTLDHADPKVGSTVSKAPEEIKIWFTEALDDGSTITVNDSSNKQVDRQDAQVDEKDKTLMTATLKPLSPGDYKVHWHAVCPCGHVTDGMFTFTVENKN